MSLDQAGVEALGWVFAALHPDDKYVRAERALPSGKLINFGGETVDEVCAQIEAWETYPVQAPNTRDADAVELESVEAPVSDDVTA